MMNIQRFAATEGVIVKTLNNIKVLGTDLKALDATAGITFDLKGYSADRIMILIVNTDGTNAENVTIKGGNGYAAAEDKTVSVTKSDFALISVETAKYAKSGVITITGSADVKAVAGYIG